MDFKIRMKSEQQPFVNNGCYFGGPKGSRCWQIQLYSLLFVAINLTHVKYKQIVLLVKKNLIYFVTS